MPMQMIKLDRRLANQMLRQFVYVVSMEELVLVFAAVFAAVVVVAVAMIVITMDSHRALDNVQCLSFDSRQLSVVAVVMVDADLDELLQNQYGMIVDQTMKWYLKEFVDGGDDDDDGLFAVSYLYSLFIVGAFFYKPACPLSLR